MQVVQTKDHVVMVTEMVHTARIVPLDGRPRLNDQIRHWSGEARGHWEGDTLVIETTNFKPERGWRGATGNMKLIERLTRLDAGTLEYKYTVIDPETWTSPWTAAIPLRLSDRRRTSTPATRGTTACRAFSPGNVPRTERRQPSGKSRLCRAPRGGQCIGADRRPRRAARVTR